MERLDKLLASTGRWTRKEGKALLNKGRVTVDGQRVTDGSLKFSHGVVITVDGVTLPSTQPMWVMLHKPQGVISATKDKEHETVLDLLPAELKERGLFPVGRLDKDTEGLLLLTEDGTLAHRLLSPRYHIAKVYYVEVEGQLTEQDVDKVSKGLILGDGLVCLPATLSLLDGGHSAHITLTQGKYHQIKRMMACLGCPVRYLKRLSMGDIVLDESLALGEWRPLSLEEISSIYQDLGEI